MGVTGRLSGTGQGVSCTRWVVSSVRELDHSACHPQQSRGSSLDDLTDNFQHLMGSQFYFPGKRRFPGNCAIRVCRTCPFCLWISFPCSLKRPGRGGGGRRRRGGSRHPGGRSGMAPLHFLLCVRPLSGFEELSETHQTKGPDGLSPSMAVGLQG